MSELFDSLNPYQSMDFVSSDTPAGLIAELMKIRTPIKILHMVSHDGQLVAFIMGDIRRKKKGNSNG